MGGAQTPATCRARHNMHDCPPASSLALYWWKRRWRRRRGEATSFGGGNQCLNSQRDRASSPTAILGSNILAWGQGPSNRGMRGETSFILIQQTFIQSLHQVLGIQYCTKSLPPQSTPSSTGDKSTDNEGGGAGSAGRVLPGRTWAMESTDPRSFIRAVTRSIYVCKRFLRPKTT